MDWMTPDPTTRRRRLLLVVAVVVLLIAAFLWQREACAAAVHAVLNVCRAAGPLVYFGAMAILPMFGFSLFAFVATAGPVFGPTLGVGHVILYGLVALSANVTISYVLASRWLRPVAMRMLRWLGYSLPDTRRFGAWEIAMLVRLLPGPPFALQSCALGVARVPFSAYLAVSVGIPALYFAAMVILGGGVAAGNHQAVIEACILLCGIGALVHWLRRRIVARIRRSDALVASGA
jgi:uncharacterized membrane protein YdjX (TVP38/TMEM64 family)